MGQAQAREGTPGGLRWQRQGGDRKNDAYEQTAWLPQVVREQRKHKGPGPEAAAPLGRKQPPGPGPELPTVTPVTNCKLRLLKLKRINDYILMEEEYFVTNQEPQEEKKEKWVDHLDQEEKLVDDLRGSRMWVANSNLEELIDENHVIVWSSVGTEDNVRQEPEPGWAIPMLNQVLSSVGLLQDEVDPMVSVMKVEKAPLESYADIGGLDAQIQEIKEASELPLTNPELYEDIGIQLPKGVILYGEPGTSKTLLAKQLADQIPIYQKEKPTRSVAAEREMANTAIDILLETLKQLITSSKLALIINEKQQLQFLDEKITYMRGFLNTAEESQDEDAQVVNLVTRIRDVVSEAENIVELYIVHAFKTDASNCRVQEDHDHLDLESVRREIEDLTAEVNKIYNPETNQIKGRAATKHHRSSTGSGTIGSSRGSDASKVIKKKVVVGFEKEVEKVTSLLYAGDSPLEIITIIGAPGGGKTTLAKEVYNHNAMSQKFDIRAWVDVSQGYDKTMKRDLLLRILESLGKHASGDADKLGEDLLKCLKGKKYLIVMDDIWDIKAWHDIQRSFPADRKGSKVLFTSRSEIQPDGLYHRLGALPQDSSWELLETEVFGGIKHCPQELVHIGKEIAEKCHGLPLSIVVIAGILVTGHSTPDAWNNVAKGLSSIVANQKGCLEIIELSYNYLPIHLKACFLYIGGFIEDSEILIRELTWLWIGEGLVQQSEEGKSLEALAKEYVFGLIARNLLKEARKSSLGRIKTFRIHDLVRELCLKKAKEVNFLATIYKDESFSPSATNKHRRLFIGNQFLQNFSSGLHSPSVRSFLCLSSPNSLPSSFEPNLSFFVKNFELLRVLSFISTACDGEIGVGHLVHLRYLSLILKTDDWSCWSYGTPFSYLLNLETLNLHVSREVDIELPRHIFKMVKLRHLYSKSGLFNYHVSRSLSSEEAAGLGFDDSSKLDSLRTLHRICCCQHCRRFLKSTPNLRKLGLYCRTSDDGTLMIPEGELELLNNLGSLSITNIIRTDIKRATLPGELKLPSSITRLTLTNTALKWKELSIIQTSLPLLEVLVLLHACCGPVWDMTGQEEEEEEEKEEEVEVEVEEEEKEEEGFPKLKYLRIKHLHIEKWIASADQFTSLEVLVLEYCQRLEGIPIEFGDLNELREIKVERCGSSVVESAEEIRDKRIENQGDDCLNLITIANLTNGTTEQ